VSTTEQDLQTAFAGESQANRKYLAYAKQAERDGLPQVAKLFRAVAAAETIHAHAHLRAMGAIGATVDNLKAALAGETHEYTDMYPAMIETAKAAGEKAAARSFSYANEVEKVHAELYRQALANPNGLAETDYHVCAVCGHTVAGPAPDKCVVCGANARAFEKID